MTDIIDSEEVNFDEQQSPGKSGFIGTIAYLASLAMPFIIYLARLFS
jgi:hypothetical protein